MPATACAVTPPMPASLGMGEGEFLVELRERERGPTGADEVTFLIRPNAGLPFAPIADTCLLYTSDAADEL